MTATTKPPRAPLSIYVLFHAKSDECRDLAHRLHDWFRLKADDGDNSEAGIPIWFRSRLTRTANASDPDATACIAPSIPWSGAEDNVIVLLADRHMVADRAWRYALERLYADIAGLGNQHRVLVLPVEVHWSLHQLGFLTAERNAVRIGDPLPETLTPQQQDAWKQAIDARARILRRAVSEAIARELVLSRAATGAPERLSVFLSHAKADGVTIAERLRDSLAQFGQLRVWYDASDLPAGYAWADRMSEAAKGLAGLVTVLTDAYHTRPWCRQEVNLARTPRRLAQSADAAGSRSIWIVQPTVAVQRAGASWSRAMAPLVHVPAIGWPDAATAELDRIADIVDRLVLEVLLASFYRRIAEQIVADPAMDLPDTHVALLTWVPEPWSVLHVLGGVLAESPARTIVLAYPGHGLRTVEREELEAAIATMTQLVAHGDGPTIRVQLVSQERLASTETLGANPLLGVTVCLSGGGDNDELEHAGVGLPHANDLFVRLARRLLEAGCRIAYGGTLANLQDNLTHGLIDAARSWVRGGRGERTRPTAASLDDPPFVNYSAWPNTQFVTLRHYAELVGICRFESVLPPNAAAGSLPAAAATPDAPETLALGADALTAMRERTADPALAPVRIVLGGKIAGAAGWLPGIAEEVLCALQQRQLPIVLGAFGGCAGLLAEFLAAASSAWPEPLTLAARERDKKLQLALQRPGAREPAARRFAELQRTVTRFRDQLHGTNGATWPFATIAATPVLELLQTASPTQCLQRIMPIVTSIAAALPHAPKAP